MTVVQVIVLTVVMVVGVAVVLAQDPLRQSLVNGVFGLALVILFVVLQGADVAFSELVVSTVAMPLVILAAVARTRDRDDR